MLVELTNKRRRDSLKCVENIYFACTNLGEKEQDRRKEMGMRIIIMIIMIILALIMNPKAAFV